MNSQLSSLGTPPLACLWFSGEDASSFLQSQLTQSIPSTASPAASFGYCNPQGRLLCTGWLAGPLDRPEGGQHIGLVVSADLIPRLQKRLQMFVLRAKVKVVAASVSAQAGPDAVAVTVALGPSAVWTLGLSLPGVAADPQSGQWSADQTAAFADDLVAAGFALITEETVEAFTPQQVNLDLVGGVSFTKGCYPGQEVVARLHYLGKNRKRMLRLDASVETTSEEANLVLRSPSAGVLVAGSLPDEWPDRTPDWAGGAAVLPMALVGEIPRPEAKPRPQL